MSGLTLTRDVHDTLRTAFERDHAEAARDLGRTLSATNWLKDEQIASLVDALFRSCQADFDTIESARNSLVGGWKRASGRGVGSSSAMVIEAQYYFSMNQEFEYTVMQPASVTGAAGGRVLGGAFHDHPNSIRKGGLYVIEDGHMMLLVGNDGSTDRTLYRVQGATLMIRGGVFWR